MPCAKYRLGTQHQALRDFFGGIKNFPRAGGNAAAPENLKAAAIVAQLEFKTPAAQRENFSSFPLRAGRATIGA